MKFDGTTSKLEITEIVNNIHTVVRVGRLSGAETLIRALLRTQGNAFVIDSELRGHDLVLTALVNDVAIANDQSDLRDMDGLRTARATILLSTLAYIERRNQDLEG